MTGSSFHLSIYLRKLLPGPSGQLGTKSKKTSVITDKKNQAQMKPWHPPWL